MKRLKVLPLKVIAGSMESGCASRRRQVWNWLTITPPHFRVRSIPLGPRHSS